MHAFLRTIRAYGIRNGADRIQAFRDEAAKEPGGLGQWTLAIVLWEEGEIAEANQLAEEFLEESPDDFHMLIICLDFHVRADNPAGILEYATRVIDVRQPSRFRIALSVLVRPRIWRDRLFGRGQINKTPEEILDDWIYWARAYVYANSPPLNS